MKQMRAGAPAGRRNPNFVDDDDAHSLAVAIWTAGDAATASSAAFRAVMLREGLEPSRTALEALADRRPEKHELVAGEIRRLRDKLYRDAGILDHINRVRSFPELLEAAHAHCDRMVASAASIRRFSLGVAILQSDPDCP